MKKFKIGDLVVAKKGDKEQVAIIFKASDVSSETYPCRGVYSARFASDPTDPITFVFNEGEYWPLPSKGPFEPCLMKVLRKKEILWTSE